jgi:hypothetical protein
MSRKFNLCSFESTEDDRREEEQKRRRESLLKRVLILILSPFAPGKNSFLLFGSTV